MANNGKGKQSKFELIIGAVGKFSNVFKGFNDNLDKTTARMRKMQGALGNLNKATGLSRLSGAVSGVSGNMKNVVSEGKNLVSTVTGLAGKLSLIFGAAGGGLFALVKSTANAGDAAAKASARAGVGVKTWQEYAHAASLSDVSNEQLEKGFVKLQDSAIKAFRGDKTQASLLKLAGINPKTARGEIKNADTLFLELADKVKALQDAGQGSKGVNLVKSILGDEGAKLMPMLLGGAEGLKSMRMEAHKLGLVLSADDAKASEGFNDGLTKMLGSLKGIGYSIGRVLLPPLTKLIEKFTQWTAKQREVIGAKFEEWAEKFSKWVDGIKFDEMSNSISGLLDKVKGIADAFGGWKNVFIALAAVISGNFLLSIGNLIMSFGKLGLAIMTTPVGWFIAACAGIGAAVYAIYKNWDKIVAYFQGLWQGVKDAFNRSWTEGIVSLLIDFNPLRLILKGMNELIAYFTGIDLFEAGAKIMTGLWDGFRDIFPKLAAWLEAKFSLLTDWMPDWVKEKLGIAVKAETEGDPSAGEGAGLGAMAAPLNMGADVRPVKESRSEHVEREEVTLVVRAAEGVVASLQRSGGGGGNVSMQNGQLMVPGG